MKLRAIRHTLLLQSPLVDLGGISGGMRRLQLGEMLSCVCLSNLLHGNRRRTAGGEFHRPQFL